ncbi:hypothetical protein EON65_51375 [archaeon]|nr:MAG: hypothetical protein EON65_51375 [archaeon]
MKVEALESNLIDVVVTNYDGDYDEETGEYSGQAIAKLDNETQYEGVFQKGLFHGKGKFTWSDGVTYEGEFKLNALHGKGTYTYADGSVYAGDISDGKRHGQGKLTTSAGQVYEGEWKDGMRHGKGKMSYTNEKAVTYTVSLLHVAVIFIVYACMACLLRRVSGWRTIEKVTG